MINKNKMRKDLEVEIEKRILICSTKRYCQNSLNSMIAGGCIYSGNVSNVTISDGTIYIDNVIVPNYPVHSIRTNVVVKKMF